MTFDNSYARLPEDFYERIEPVPVDEPGFIRLNQHLADELGLALPTDEKELAAIFSGNTLLPGSEPIAQAYAGHQFGHFVPQLGDGRAVLLGEVVTDSGKRFDIQLKGSGKTKFSRGGDGRSPLGPVIREYVVSEAMYALGVPTSRTLAMVETGEKVFRETRLAGGISTRVTSSHVRVGTFEYFAARKMWDEVKLLADYVIDRHYPEAHEADNPYVALFESVVRAQANLVAHWMRLGFIHGVMNTDNTLLCGETIDYGPCAFMDHYDPAKVFSSIDHQGRYAFNNQPAIAQWNMACLGGCLVPLLHDDAEKAHETGEAILQTFTPTFKAHYQGHLCAKIGLESNDANFELVRDFNLLLHRYSADFTVAYRSLCDAADGNESPLRNTFDGNDLNEWLTRWRETTPPNAEAMRRVNPTFIPRNHRIEDAIQAAYDGDFAPTHKLIDILANPFDDQPENEDYMLPPKPEEQVQQTFCGT